ncbi:toxin VasX [Thalassospira sp. TSL5-1]|uniref:toxin VasX n=1 Tax=Thalassospira sp. TSL5-1 TaxID=1544451 RepID=UPI00093C6E7A|nr:toxin VasX [Thalassospira sp. TSL5-1]OKH86434.1 hypothetical protein LF95_22770 [Thalassospira sp. TSL5-1]
MDYGDFSANADSEETFFPCKRGMIPILPVRFSLLPYDLDSVQEPTSIGNPGSYIIRTLRRGFVYVYVENPQETDEASDRQGPGFWYVFRYDTKSQDINGDFVPQGTDSYHRADYSFTKYEWTDNYGAGAWKYDSSTPASKTIWVPKWASKVWLAYSEYRWPPSFFRQGHQESFRKQIMQPVNLRGQNQWAAYIGKAEELVEEFKPAPKRKSPILATRLSLSQTKFAAAVPPKISDECAVIAALHDPLGDILEMKFRYAAKVLHKQNFANANAYPLTIGRFCKVIKDQVPDRKEWYQLQRSAFADGWEVSYDSLVSAIESIDHSLEELITGINTFMSNENDHYLGKHLALGFHQENDPAAVFYASLMLGRVLDDLGATARGHIAIRKGLGGAEDIPDADRNNGSALNTSLRAFFMAWEDISPKYYDQIRKSRFIFDLTIEAIALEIAVEPKVRNDPVLRNAIENVYRRSSDGTIMLTKRQVSFEDAVRFLQGTFNDAEVKDLVAGISRSGKLHLSAIDTRMPTVDLPAVEINGDVKLLGGLRTDRTIYTLEGGAAGISLLLGFWALCETAQTQEKTYELFKKGELTSVLTSKAFNVTTIAVSIADAALTLGTKTATAFAPTEQISQNALRALYQRAIPRGAADLLYAPRLASVAGVGRIVPLGLPRLSIVLTALSAYGGYKRGLEREDPAQIIGNVSVFIGALMMFFEASPIVSAVFLIIGTGITLLSYSDIEDVVRKCFWGSRTPYWGLKRRVNLIEKTRNLPTPWNKRLRTEIHWFEDLLWTIKIENSVDDDGLFFIESPAFAEEKPGILDLNIRELRGRFWQVKYNLATGQLSGDDHKEQIHVRMIAGSSAIVVKIDPGPDFGKLRGPNIAGRRHEFEEGYYIKAKYTRGIKEYTGGDTPMTITGELLDKGRI